MEEDNLKKSFIVRGQLRQPDGSSLSGVKVRAYHKELRREKLLGEAVTDDNGCYEIKPAVASADLILRAIGPKGEELAASDVRFHSGQEETIDLRASRILRRSPSEFERLSEDIKPHLKDIKVKGITRPSLVHKLSDLKNDEIEILAGKAGGERLKIEQMAAAAKMQLKAKDMGTDLPVEVFYALSEQGKPLDLGALYHRKSKDLRESLENAVKENVLPSFSGENLDKVVEDLKHLSVKHVLNTPPKEGYAALGELFSLSLPDPTKQATLLSLFSEQERPDEAFWTKLKDHPDFQEPGLIDRIKLTSQLAVLTQNHLPLMQELQQRKRIKTLRDLADLDQDDWKSLLRKKSDGKSIGIPTGIAGDGEEQRIDDYAKSIFENLRAAFPTTFVGKALARQPKILSRSLKDVLDSNPDLNLAKPLPDDFDWDSLSPEVGASLQALQREIRMFPDLDYKSALEKASTSSTDFENPIRNSVSRFFDNVPEFDLSRTHIDSYLAEHGEEAFKNIDEKDIPLVTSHLKSLQRVFNITPKYEQIEALIGSGLNSAYAASTTPKPVFLSYFSPLLGGEDQAKKILAQAQQINAKNTLVLTTLYQEIYDATPAVIGNASGEIKKIPNLENLFGRMDLCDCEHCRSFYSPAAYFVDLLHFLDSNVDQIGEQKTPVPIDSLLKRRPDLVHIKLSCENTNTLIPYVDLVNEILEFYVAYGMLSHAAAKNSEGFTSEELLADPQYMQDEAYKKLMKQVYPFSLPFNQPLEQARLYLEHLGTSLSQVKQIFGRNELNSTLRATDAEILGISHQEYEVLTDEKFDGTVSRKTLQEYYGFDDNNFNCSDLKHLKMNIAADPSPEVIALQRMLNLAGADPALNVDGKFGLLTHKAVTDFQRKNSLTVDGVVGPKTWKTLMQAHPDCWKVWLAQVPVFLSHSGLSYIELVELVKTHFINPNRETLNFWDKTYAGYKYVKSFYKSEFIKLDPKLNDILIEAGISVDDYSNFFKGSFGDVNLPSPDISSVTVVLASPDLSCDLSLTRIQNLNDTELTDHTLNKMHRFVRLWRKLGWSMHELDVALVSLNNNYGVVRPQVLQDLAEIKQMQSELNLPPLVLLSFWRDIDANGKDSLYHKLFLSKPDYIDEAFKLGSDGKVLTDKGKLIIEHESAILAALQISSADLSILLSELNLEPNYLKVNGVYGVETRLALITFQKKLGLEMSGIAGLDIWKALAKDHLDELSKNMPVLKLGSKGTAVRVLHNMLPNIGRVTTLFPSSTFSRDTFYRVMAFQQNNNIDEIGTAGPKTWKALISKDLSVFASTMPVLRFGEKDSTVEILQRMLVALEIKPAPYLTINNVSALYRHAVLAKALRLRILDLMDIKKLCEIDPFKSTKNARQFIEIVSTIKESGFAVGQLKYIYSHISNPPSSFAPQRISLLLLAKNLRDNLTKILEDNSIIEDPTGEITRSKLGEIFEDQVVNDIIKMLDNSMIYYHKLAKVPNLSIDTTGLSIISYDTISKHLQFKGEMAQSERELLLSLSKDRDYQNAIDKIFQTKISMKIDEISRAPLEKIPALTLDTLSDSKIHLNKTADSSELSIRIKGAMTSREKEILDSLSEDLDYRNAIDGLYTQPRNFLSNTLDKKQSGFLNINDARSKLFNDDLPMQNIPLAGMPPGLSLLRSKAPLETHEKFKYVLHYLQPFLRDKLSRSAVKQIITDTLSLDASIAELLLEDLNDGKAIKNCLSLINSGLSADYFLDTNFKMLAESRIDTAIAFNGKGKPPENIMPKNVSSARWRGMLLAPNNGKYSFFINSNCSAKLWIDEKLILDAPASSTETEKIGEESLKAGQLYDLRVELVKNGSMDVAELSWSGPGTPKAIIPSANLYPLSSFENFAESYIWLHKISLLVNGFDLNSKDMAYISRNPSDFEEFRFEDLPAKSSLEKESNTADLFKSWLKLYDFVSLRDSLPQGEIGLVDIVSCISLKEMEKKLILATGWDEKTLDSILENIGFKSTGRRFRKQDWIPTIKRLQACMQKIKLLGVSSENLFKWANEPIDGAQARMIKDAVRAKYDKETWLSVAKPISDRMREKQRDALIAYVLTMPNIRHANVADSNQLFEYFLIDPEMSACMKTSRIKQAISSVQLFVQRCLMNLEQDVSPEMVDYEQWEWMKHYRIWEANRKVFLYPENWIEPELRDDKTPLFKEFESDLLQSDINEETAELALRHYLEKLDNIKKLDICAMCYDREQHIYHIFGRTYNYPNKYYYTKIIRGGSNDVRSWICVPWQNVDLDIKAPASGIHLIPVVFNKRLYLFWPEFQDKSLPEQFCVDINLAFSEYRNGKWLPKITSDKISFEYIDRKGNFLGYDNSWSEKGFENILKDLTCVYGIDESCIQGIDFKELFINLYESVSKQIPNDNYRSRMGVCKFSMLDGGSLIKIEKLFDKSLGGEDFIPNINADYCYGSYQVVNHQVNTHQLNMCFKPNRNKNNTFYVFKCAPEDYRQIYANDSITREYSFNSSNGFFYDDSHRSYFIIPFFNIIMSPTTSTYTLSSIKLVPFFHPHVDKFMQELSQNGILGLMTIENQKLGENDQGNNSNFHKLYDPTDYYISSEDYPSENVEFKNGVYAQYNRELFFHAPILIADRLSKNQRFEEAQKWFHYIFNPLDDRESNPDSPMQRYWKYLPFYENINPENQSIFKILLALNDHDPELEKQVNEWRRNPFEPHLIARSRITAYQKNAVMKYIENIISWGDQLFRQDTIESINEATQLYILAANILGSRPENLPIISKIKSKTYHDLKPILNSLSNPMVNIETTFPVCIIPISNLSCYNPVISLPMISLNRMIDSCSASDTIDSKLQTINEKYQEYEDLKVPNVGYTFYFCIPYNYKLIDYWDKVDDRLFKIRHCMNIEGYIRELPLFEPPIDPALLVQAAARGVDLSSVLSDINSQRAHYRFPLILQKALELCSEVRSYGAGLLSALEKKDAEELANMRAKHETFILEQVKSIKERQFKEAEESYDALLKSRDIYVSKYQHYQKLLGVQNPLAPPLNSILPDFQASQRSVLAESEGSKLILEEMFEIENIRDAIDAIVNVEGWELLANLAHYAPKFIQDIPPSTKIEYGGDHIGHALASYSKGKRNWVERLLLHGNSSNKIANYIRREQEWVLQNNLAAKEIMQIDKQIVAAEIRKEIAKIDVLNHEKQIENAKEIEDHFRNKYTNKELYGWMIGQISGIYFQCYQMAFDMAKRAENTYRFELGILTSNFIQFGYWDSLRKGLLAGEQLYLALKQMEKAYLEQNRREYEITKNISLMIHEPMALIRLKETGECQFTMPEAFFDADYPGHYMRRIKSVSLTIPCVAGPYTSINCKLTLLSNKTRINSNAQRSYPEGEEDNRFVTNFAAMQSIATSHAQNDSGMFELNFRDERYLPFEGAGAISRWRIEMDKDCNAFDFNSISDVILKLNYTSRDGGELLRQKAKENLMQLQSELCSRLFSMKHEFPNEWHAFLTTQTMEFKLAQERFSYQLRGKDITVLTMDLYLLTKDDTNRKELGDELDMSLDTPSKDILKFRPGSNLGSVFSAQISNMNAGITETSWKITAKHARVNEKTIEDLVIICHYSAQERK